MCNDMVKWDFVSNLLAIHVLAEEISNTVDVGAKPEVNAVKTYTYSLKRLRENDIYQCEEWYKDCIEGFANRVQKMIATEISMNIADWEDLDSVIGSAVKEFKPMFFCSGLVNAEHAWAKQHYIAIQGLYNVVEEAYDYYHSSITNSDTINDFVEAIEDAMDKINWCNHINPRQRVDFNRYGREAIKHIKDEDTIDSFDVNLTSLREDVLENIESLKYTVASEIKKYCMINL